VPIVRVVKRAGFTREMYDAVMERLQVEADPPDGLVMHCSGEVDGRWQVVEIWESEEHARRFLAERLLPMMEATLGPRPGPPPTAIYELRKLITP
jgi:hypothetical protein